MESMTYLYLCTKAAHRRQACELGRAPAKEEETGPTTQVLEPRHRDGCHPGHGVSSVI